MEKIKIGKIVNAVALKGEVKVYHYSDCKERFEELSYILAGEKKYDIENVRYMHDLVILKLASINDRNAAEAMKDTDVYITAAELKELPEDTYYVRDILGMGVFLEDDTKLGILTDVIQRSAQDLYEIENENKKKILIPNVKEFVLDINMESKKITVRPPEGLLDL